jgi:hypothetical protein
MGMYDLINYEMICPNCEKKVDGFQTKDLSCQMETFNPDQCDNFYSICDYCDARIEFDRIKQNIDPLNAFRMTVTNSELDEKCFLRNSEG